MNGSNTLINIRGLVKRFGAFTAVNGIDVDVQRGEFFGILGPNGAGKSSTMRMIGCVSPPTEGTIRVLGMDPLRDGHRIRARLGVCPQADSLDSELTVRENLTTYARYFGISRRIARARAHQLLDLMQLADRAGGAIQTLSGGMKRRLVIARALINEPDLVLLDEPTTGLTTHYMDEAEQLCDRLVVMDAGTIVGEGAPAALIERYASQEVVELRLAGENPSDHGGALSGIDGRIEVLADRILLYCRDGDRAAAEIRRRGLAPAGLLVRRGSLEDVFLRLTGRELME
jgi:lipooligosaccharide transport system ATP-binding protein